MRMTKGQAAAIIKLARSIEIDQDSLIKIEEDPDMEVDLGVLRVTLRDRWSHEVVRIERSGAIAPTEPQRIWAQIPGQTQISYD